MQFSTLIVLACLIATVVASIHYHHQDDGSSIHDEFVAHNSQYEHSELRSPRMKRGLLLLKKKLLLGALGLKAAKVGAVGAGIAGALALKSKASVPKDNIQIYYH